MDYQSVLDQVYETLEPEFGSGEVASYIPQLSKVDPNQLAIALYTEQGETFSVGSDDQAFSVQSISKLFSLTMAIQDYDEALWERVGREPSGDPFNSLVQLEHEQGKPRNPFINSGALVLCDAIQSSRSDAKASVLDFARELSGNPAIGFDLEVAESEYLTGYRNIAMANFMKSFGAIVNDVDPVVDSYFHHCSIAMNCKDLAKACSFLAGSAANPKQAPIVSNRQIKRINALMATCGTYDAAGEIAYRVGLPCKSGVGGGIIAVLPGKYTVCVWSPGLDQSGNSLVGVKALEELTTVTGLSIF